MHTKQASFPAVSMEDYMKNTTTATSNSSSSSSSNNSANINVIIDPSSAQVTTTEGRRRAAQRENLEQLTAEEKLERRKERARMYSHLARRRQEATVQDLKNQVESLGLYKDLIDNAPDLVLVISPDVEARILFANGASVRMLQLLPTALLGRYVEAGKKKLYTY